MQVLCRWGRGLADRGQEWLSFRGWAGWNFIIIRGYLSFILNKEEMFLKTFKGRVENLSFLILVLFN